MITLKYGISNPRQANDHMWSLLKSQYTILINYFFEINVTPKSILELKVL